MVAVEGVGSLGVFGDHDVSFIWCKRVVTILRAERKGLLCTYGQGEGLAMACLGISVGAMCSPAQVRQGIWGMGC